MNRNHGNIRVEKGIVSKLEKLAFIHYLKGNIQKNTKMDAITYLIEREYDSYKKEMKEMEVIENGG